MDLVRDSALGVEFEIDPRFARVDPLRTWETAEPQDEAPPPAPDRPPGCAGGPGRAGAPDSQPAAAPDDLPSAHFIASQPQEGWIAALAIVTVDTDPLPAGEWQERQLARTRASFAGWSSASHVMLTPPEPAALAGRPALHVRYRLTGADPAGADAGDAPDAATPPSLVEHWTVLVEERARLLVLELMVQPPERWPLDRAALTLPFRTLAIV